MKQGSARKILIKSKRQVFSELIGSNSTLFRGEGYDFMELREYQIGDDIRHIDWVITAKQNKPFVKIFHKEHQINVVIATILNGSVFFGTKRLKQDLIAEIAAILAFGSIKNSDSFSHWIFADKLYSHTKQQKKQNGVEKLINDVLNFDAIKKGFDKQTIEKELMLRVKRKSLIFAIGDFFALPDLSLLAKKHEVIALVVRDKHEEKLPDLDEATLIDPQTMEYFEGSLSSGLKKEYEKKVHEIDKNLNDYFKKHGIRWVKLYTDEDPFAKLLRLFKE